MGQTDSEEATRSLEELRRRFEAWRSAGPKGRRIPAGLWQAATELAGDLGVNRVSRAVHLDYPKLKQRLVERGDVNKETSPARVGSTFVELAVDTVVQAPECFVEFKGVRGAFTMRLTGHRAADVVALAEALSRSGR